MAVPPFRWQGRRADVRTTGCWKDKIAEKSIRYKKSIKEAGGNCQQERNKVEKSGKMRPARGRNRGRREQNRQSNAVCDSKAAKISNKSLDKYKNRCIIKK